MSHVKNATLQVQSNGDPTSGLHAEFFYDYSSILNPPTRHFLTITVSVQASNSPLMPTTTTLLARTIPRLLLLRSPENPQSLMPISLLQLVKLRPIALPVLQINVLSQRLLVVRLLCMLQFGVLSALCLLVLCLL